MPERFAWKNGQWLAQADVHLSLDDWGLIQGAVIVDRLRTVRGELLDVPAHLQRLRQNCADIGISIDIDQIGDAMQVCVLRHLAFYGQQDFSIVVLITPGLNSHTRLSGQSNLSATRIVHSSAIDWKRLDYVYRHGQALMIASHRNVPSVCWSPTIKTRSRLQYFLADQQASQMNLPFAGAVLLDTNDCVTETSWANVVLVRGDNQLLIPPMANVLPGISLNRTLRLARNLGLQVIETPLTVEMIPQATELILTGTTGCIWPASRLGSHAFPKPSQCAVYQRLLQAWIEELGFNFVEQAERLVLG